MIDRIEKGYILKTHLFTPKMLIGVRFISILDIAINASNQLCLNLIVCVFEQEGQSDFLVRIHEIIEGWNGRAKNGFAFVIVEPLNK